VQDSELAKSLKSISEAMGKNREVQQAVRKEIVVAKWTSMGDRDEPAAWTRKCQAGVWFWQHSETGETTTAPPTATHEREANVGSKAFKSRQGRRPSDAGTGSLVYDDTEYHAFEALVGSSGFQPP